MADKVLWVMIQPATSAEALVTGVMYELFVSPHLFHLTGESRIATKSPAVGIFPQSHQRSVHTMSCPVPSLTQRKNQAAIKQAIEMICQTIGAKALRAMWAGKAGGRTRRRWNRE